MLNSIESAIDNLAELAVDRAVQEMQSHPNARMAALASTAPYPPGGQFAYNEDGSRTRYERIGDPIGVYPVAP